MSELTSIEKRNLEKLFRMGGGYQRVEGKLLAGILVCRIQPPRWKADRHDLSEVMIVRILEGNAIDPVWHPASIRSDAVPQKASGSRGSRS